MDSQLNTTRPLYKNEYQYSSSFSKNQNSMNQNYTHSKTQERYNKKRELQASNYRK
jgi:hypothetical protein